MPVIPSPYLLIYPHFNPSPRPSSLLTLSSHPSPILPFFLNRSTLYLSPNPSFPPFFLPLLIRSPFSLLLITHPSFLSLFLFIFLFTHPSSRPFLSSVRPLFHYPSFLPSRTQFIHPLFFYFHAIQSPLHFLLMVEIYLWIACSIIN